MKVVFLDFDGVLNKGHGPGVPALVKRLNTITDRTGAAIVVHSSWRWARSVETLREILVSWGVTGPVLDKCPHPVMYRTEPGGMVVGVEDWAAFQGNVKSNSERCIAIQRWLDDHTDVEEYVILDDCPGLGYFVGKPPFIQTQMNVGLTEEHVSRALKHLAGGTK